jgi:hypothetical protein
MILLGSIVPSSVILSSKTGTQDIARRGTARVIAERSYEHCSVHPAAGEAEPVFRGGTRFLWSLRLGSVDPAADRVPSRRLDGSLTRRMLH